MWGQGHSTRLGKSGWQIARERDQCIAEHDGICHVCGKPGATQMDHVTPLAQGGTDTPDNRRPIHANPCHHDKTAREASAARSRRRPTERHPGLL